MTKVRPEIFVVAAAVSLLWSKPASAGLIGDILCSIFQCQGGGGGGPVGAPEIDGSAAVTGLALVASIAAILYQRSKR